MCSEQKRNTTCQHMPSPFAHPPHPSLLPHIKKPLWGLLAADHGCLLRGVPRSLSARPLAKAEGRSSNGAPRQKQRGPCAAQMQPCSPSRDHSLCLLPTQCALYWWEGGSLWPGEGCLPSLRSSLSCPDFQRWECQSPHKGFFLPPFKQTNNVQEDS